MPQPAIDAESIPTLVTEPRAGGRSLRLKPTLRAAEVIADLLARKFPSIDGICLYGSLARGGATP